MSKKMNKDFKKAIDNVIPLKPTLKQMQDAVDEWRNDTDEILDSMRNDKLNYETDDEYDVGKDW